MNLKHALLATNHHLAAKAAMDAANACNEVASGMYDELSFKTCIEAAKSMYIRAARKEEELHDEVIKWWERVHDYLEFHRYAEVHILFRVISALETAQAFTYAARKDD